MLQSSGAEAAAVTIIHVCSFLVITPHDRNLLSPYYVPDRTWGMGGRVLTSFRKVTVTQQLRADRNKEVIYSTEDT